jgi:hypothetical protein
MKDEGNVEWFWATDEYRRGRERERGRVRWERERGREEWR